MNLPFCWTHVTLSSRHLNLSRRPHKPIRSCLQGVSSYIWNIVNFGERDYKSLYKFVKLMDWITHSFVKANSLIWWVGCPITFIMNVFHHLCFKQFWNISIQKTSKASINKIIMYPRRWRYFTFKFRMISSVKVIYHLTG